MVKTIFFDFDGVLTTDPSGWYTTCKNMQTLMPDISFDTIAACYTRRREELSLGKMNHEDMWQEFCECLGVTLDISTLPEIFKNTPMNEKMFKLCGGLKNNYTLGIITDNNLERFQILENSMNLANFFSIRILSAHVGARKTEQLIFNKALESAQCRPEECIFIDNHEHNLVVPRDMGFKTFFYDQAKNDVDLLVHWLHKQGVVTDNI